DGGGQTVAILFDTRALALEESGHFWLSPTPEEPGSTGGDAWGLAGVPRMVTWVRLSFVEGEGELYVYNTHLPANETGGARARRLATLLLAERIAKRARSDVPFLLLGDLNATEDEFPLRYLEREVPGCEGAGCPEPPAFSPVAVVDTWRAANSGTQGTRCGVSEDGTVVLHGARVDYVLAGDPTVGDPSAAPISAPEVLASAIALESDGCASDHVPVVSRIVLPHPRATSSASARDPRAVARGKGAPAR
ncbi:MAG TPA: endonuclease/exonuclease/phosphatase family protein, partial [Longimicrobiales bacterium]|nr:endonuclease/exonuclease/phosphatase family protein [Longimicrobiales bacterium]